MPAAITRPRVRSGAGRGQLLALAAVGLVILGLTFALGMLVGRQWARQTPATLTAESKKARPGARGALGEPGERPSQLQEKLTFYQTLTAPLGAPSPSSSSSSTGASNGSASKAAAEDRSRLAASRATDRFQDMSRGIPDQAPVPDSASATAPSPAGPIERSDEAQGSGPAQADGRQPRGPEWTVQVGVFKSAQQAESIRKHLSDGGFEAQIASMTTDDGQTWYRVRVGGFKARDEALQMAQRVRSERSLPTFVTTK